MEKQREHFGGRIAVILAFAGSAIGLGNLWRFPYMVGEFGGAAFILVYIVAAAFLSLPIFLAESIIGRSSGRNTVGSMNALAPKSRFWRILGYLSVITPMVIVSYYSVVGGWSLEYLFKAGTFSFFHADPEQTGGMFSALISSVWTPLLCHTLFIALNCAIVAAGVKSGIEKFSKITMPLLFVMIVMIMIFSLSLPGSGEGVAYLLKPDFSKITAKACANALGQAFFSMSLGMGIIITYSSYVSKQENLMASAGGTAVMDLFFALLAGFAIMPAVFSAGIEPSAGPGLIFQTLPHIFTQTAATMPWLSSVVAILFFLSVLVAAMTSAISMIEVGVAWLVEEKGLRRGLACVLVFAVTWAVGSLCSLSFGPLSGMLIMGNNFFEFLDKLSSNFLLTLGGLLGVLFVGWKMDRDVVRDELTNNGTKKGNAAIFGVTYFIIKYVAPIAIAIIFVTNFI